MYSKEEEEKEERVMTYIKNIIMNQEQIETFLHHS